ncbi:Metallo-hydrolase/oxidoreductase [Meira miltonrushii]|uniref:ribonuclease Z n=1 Tax=Meira miltonrushii TaxID=1280837 RepID=A0A316VAN0_9BASI|nr:Metallo-hydrolase/oxidoreductase [Meira miltonrushii]PWN33253.1 Metallo-hydrolase/oxidoreductase [Meira miltonrushii]
MLSTLRIIHPPSSDNPTCLPILLLTVDNKKFLFNVPEGTTRILLQRGTGGALRNFKGIFVPRSGIDECGGLAGMLMSLADRSLSEVELYGPPVLSQLVCTARSYARRDTFKVSIHESNLSDNGSSSSTNGGFLYKDADIGVQAIPVYPKGFSLPYSNGVSEATSDRPSKKQKSEDSIDQNRYAPTAEVQHFLNLMFSSKTHSNGNDQEIENGSDEEAAQRAKVTQSRFQRLSPPPLPSIELSEANAGQAPALTFIVRGSPVRGRFDAQKAREIGVPDPALFRALASGQDIEISRPIQWFEWDEKRKNAWYNQLKALKAAKSGKNTKAKKAATVGDDELANVETETVTIYSKDLLAPSIPSTDFAQVYLPSIDYLDSFLSANTQAQFEAAKEQMHTMIHAVHPDVLETDKYQAFIKSFPTTHHYISCRQYVPDKLGYTSFSTSMLRLSRIDQTLFKVPNYSLTPERSLTKVGLGLSNILPIDTETLIGLQPRKPPTLKDANIKDFNFAIDSPEAEALASFSYEPELESQAAPLERGRQRWTRYLQLIANLHEEEMQDVSHDATSSQLDKIALTTLGTGSALPSKHRNVSSTLLHLPDDQGYILLDVGEGTYGQLCRRFGAEVDEVIRNIRLIFLSHTHGDHHMGTAKLLAERKKLSIDRPLFVLSNTFTRAYLSEVNDIQSLDICTPKESGSAKRGVIFLESENFDSWHGIQPDSLVKSPTPKGQEDKAYRAFTENDIRNYVDRTHRDSKADHNIESRVNFVMNQTMKTKNPLRDAVKQQLNALEDSLSGTKVFTTEVDHRGAKCFGIVLRGEGWSMAYSGDTQPCERFVQAGKDVDILLHEATFENGEEENAAKKKHSTVGQALDVARKMGAKKLLLTHFSQRYPNIPKIRPEQAGGDNSGMNPLVGISFDLMTVRPNDIGKTERYREALQVLFDAEEEDGGDEDSGEGENREKSKVKSEKENANGKAKRKDAKETESVAEGK